jgi:hypothetical protein
VGVGSGRIHVISHSHTVCNDKWFNTEILNDAEPNIHRKWVLEVGFYGTLLIDRHTVNPATGIIFLNIIED